MDGIEEEKEICLDHTIYLPKYFTGSVVKLFEKKSNQEVLYWDFGKEVCQTVKQQIEILLKYIVKISKNKEERRDRYLIPLKYLFCYAENTDLQDIMKMEIVQE